MGTSNLGANIRPSNAGKGRPKGTPNKATASVKAALLEAFEQKGGVRSLLKWAKENETEFYKLWAKMLPQEVTGKDGAPVAIRVVFEDPVQAP